MLLNLGLKWKTRVQFGYWVEDLDLNVPAPAVDFKVLRDHRRPSVRRIMGLDLGPSMKHYTQPYPDICHPANRAAAERGRIGLVLPKVDAKLFNKFSSFCSWFIDSAFTPISPETDVADVPGWLLSTNYTLRRKAGLQSLADNMPFVTRWPGHWVKNKAFLKDESYVAYKVPRGIHSRTDYAKVLMGPVFKLIDDCVFSHPSFIKKIPVADRPAYVRQELFRPGCLYYNTDHSKFEAHMTRQVMLACELKLYARLLKFHPQTYRLLAAALSGTNVMDFGDQRFSVVARRMSGDMCTSVGNGITNLLLNAFLMHESGVTIDPKKSNSILVEGDDGLFSMPSTKVLPKDLYSRLGFDVKLAVSQDPCFGCFCGMLYNPATLHLFKDPIKTLTYFGWTSFTPMKRAKAVSLLLAKAMSLLVEMHNCPILGALALSTILRLRPTVRKGKRGDARLVVPRSVAYWTRSLQVFDFPLMEGADTVQYVDVDSFLAKFPLEVSDEDRRVYDDLFHISPDVQRALEKGFFEWAWPFDNPLLDDILLPARPLFEVTQRYVCNAC